MTDDRHRTARVALAVAVAAAGFVAVLLAAAGGPVTVVRDPPPVERRRPVGQIPDGTDTDAVIGTLVPPGQERIDSGWVAGVAVVLVVLVLLLVAYSIISTWPGRIAVRPPSVPHPAGPLDPLPEPPPSVHLDTGAQASALAHGAVRNAIVACWAQMEVDVARAGIPRDAAETSAEYTARVLTRSSLDGAAVRKLADLYREARFSRHDLDETHRRRAMTALDRIHASLAPAPAPAGGPR